MGKKAKIQANRMYGDLSYLFHIITPPDHYINESNFVANKIKELSAFPPKTLLNLGSGAGHNDMTLKNHFKLTGVDISENMQERARRLNPEVTYIRGDMRTYEDRILFDAVTAFDAISYMTTEKDLKAVFRTAYNLVRPGGIFYTMNENRPGDFRQNKTVTTVSNLEDINLVYIENYFDTNPDDTEFEGLFIYIIRENGELRVENDRHILGIFPDETWEMLLEETGFKILEKIDNTEEHCTEFFCRKQIVI